MLSPGIFEYIEDNKTIWEQESLQRLTSDQQLLAFKHTGFWHSVDTQRDLIRLNEMWDRGCPAENLVVIRAVNYQNVKLNKCTFKAKN